MNRICHGAPDTSWAAHDSVCPLRLLDHGRQPLRRGDFDDVQKVIGISNDSNGAMAKEEPAGSANLDPVCMVDGETSVSNDK